MTWTDEELVARSIGGDSDSFNELVHRWERPIYALAYRQLRREEDARDVCQETFLRAYRALHGFRGQAKFSSWLYRIALNLCRDWMRRERRTPVVQAPEDVDLMDLAAAREPSELIEDRLARNDLSRAVERAMALPAGRPAHGDRAEGVPRADVSGNCGPGRLSAEHGEDAVVSGVDGPAPRAGAHKLGREKGESGQMTGYGIAYG
jgi:RNA polymerase sigma factor (sigma-70 family)